jgi:hypothetical protein
MKIDWLYLAASNQAGFFLLGFFSDYYGFHSPATYAWGYALIKLPRNGANLRQTLVSVFKSLNSIMKIKVRPQIQEQSDFFWSKKWVN